MNPIKDSQRLRRQGLNVSCGRIFAGRRGFWVLSNGRQVSQRSVPSRLLVRLLGDLGVEVGERGGGAHWVGDLLPTLDRLVDEREHGGGATWVLVGALASVAKGGLHTGRVSAGGLALGVLGVERLGSVQGGRGLVVAVGKGVHVGEGGGGTDPVVLGGGVGEGGVDEGFGGCGGGAVLAVGGDEGLAGGGAGWVVHLQGLSILGKRVKGSDEGLGSSESRRLRGLRAGGFSHFLTMGCIGDVLTKTLPYDVFDDVLKKPEHRACDAY